MLQLIGLCRNNKVLFNLLVVIDVINLYPPLIRQNRVLSAKTILKNYYLVRKSPYLFKLI